MTYIKIKKHQHYEYVNKNTSADEVEIDKNF